VTMPLRMTIPTTTNIVDVGKKMFRAAASAINDVFVALSAGVLPFFAGFVMIGEVTGL